MWFFNMILSILRWFQIEQYMSTKFKKHSKVQFSITPCVWPLLITFWSLLVIKRSNISYSKMTQINLSGNFPSIDGSEVQFSIKQYFWPYLTRWWSSLVTWSNQWEAFHWIRLVSTHEMHTDDTYIEYFQRVLFFYHAVTFEPRG